MLSHARVNSKSVRGAAGTTRARDGAGADVAGVGSLGGSATAGAVTSHVLNTVLFPDMRKIPPPTRPTDFASRACLASLNDDAGVGFDAAGAGAGFIGADFPSGGGGGVEGGWTTRRELTGFKRRSSPLPLGWVTMGGWSLSSTMVIGTRRRFGGAAGEEDEASAGVAVESLTGADRCPTMCVKSWRGCLAKANRSAYCLSFSLSVHDKPVHACELGLDCFVVRFEFECPLKICGRTDVVLTSEEVRLVVGYVPLWASPSLSRAARAWALRKSAFTFLLLERPSTVEQSRSASSFLHVAQRPQMSKELIEGCVED